jgi:hypothetical protein
MRLNPKSDAEIEQLEGLLPKGTYDYEVIGAAEKTSAKGNDMIELKVRVFAGETSRVVTDYLLDAMAGKLKRFCDSHGFESEYNEGVLAASDCIGKSGKCMLGVKVDKAGKYPDKNQITDYIVELTPITARPKAKRAAVATAPPSSADMNVSDDDVPF